MLAPMAGVTDMAFREICRAMGADFSFTEMVSAKGVHYGGEGSSNLLRASEAEGLFGVQLFASDADVLKDTVHRICGGNNAGMAVIDINMGCPARKIVSNGEGCALMKNLPLASKLIETAAKASNVPVTVKFRKGFDAASINAVEFAKMAQDSGAALVTIHGRTRDQMYSGTADWDIIAKVKASVNIPVIGNGDVFSGADAVRMREYTLCDGIMVARGAQGNPFIFGEIKAALNGETYIAPAVEERVNKALEHARLLRRYKGERSVVQMRKHVAWYARNMRGAATLRTAANAAKTFEELAELLEDYKRQHLA